MLLQVQSTEPLEDWIKQGRLRRAGPDHPSADTLRRRLDRVDPVAWHRLLHQVGRRLLRNRLADRHRVGGQRVVALDGVEPWEHPADPCAACLTRHHTNGTVGYSHRLVVASLVGPVPVVLAWTGQHPEDGATKAEGELTAAHRWLADLAHTYHHSFDVRVRDALYCNRPLLAAIRDRGGAAVIRLQDERRTLGQDAVGLLAGTAPVATRTTPRETIPVWEATDVPGDPVEGLRVVHGQRVDRADATVHPGWAVSSCGPAVTALDVYDIMHHRWDEENGVFREGQTTWQLAHAFGHTPALVEATWGLPLLAVSIWHWWQAQGTRSRADQRRPRVRLVERARDACAGLRTSWAAAFWHTPP